MNRSRWDVLVVGGGPAGSTLALKLSQFGYRVLLLEKGFGARQHVAETLPGSIHRILDELGLRDCLAQAGVPRIGQHVVCWGEDRPRVALYEATPDGSYCVWRGEFDRVLLDAARARGVEVRLGVSALEIGHRRRGAVEVNYRQEGESEGSLRARLVADSTGRAGWMARNFRRRVRAFRTLALTGYWLTRERSPQTLIEAFPRGWIWSAPMRHGLRDVTLLMDRQASRGNSGGELYLAGIARAPYAASLVRGASLVNSPRGCDATPYSSRRFAGKDFILIGDSASSLDPLSAHGVYKAMDSALTAAAVLHTLLERPERRLEAIQFYQSREKAVYNAAQQRARQLYRQETRWPEKAFWRKRRSRSRPARVSPRGRVLPPLRGESRLRPAPGTRLVRAPVLEGDFIEKREVVVGAGHRRGVRYLGRVPLPELFQRVAEGGMVGEIARNSSLGFKEAFEALDWLYRAGILEEA